MIIRDNILRELDKIIRKEYGFDIGRFDLTYKIADRIEETNIINDIVKMEVIKHNSRIMYYGTSTTSTSSS